MYRVRQISRLPAFLAVPFAKLVVADGMLYARMVEKLDFDKASPIESIAQATTPILLIHGLADTRTPPSHSQRLAAANPRNSLWLVPNADHTATSTVQPEEFHRRVLDWFSSH